MSRVFISYSRQDGKDVNLIARKLEDAGYKIWLDRSAIQGGTKWQQEIVSGIEKANVFLIALSPHSIESENVERELGLAHVTGKRILPVMLHRVTVPQSWQYALGSLEIIDVSAEDIETASQHVVQAIALPDAGTRIVYLDAPRRDKLLAYLLEQRGYVLFLFVLFFLQFLQQRLNIGWSLIAFILVAVLMAGGAIWGFRRLYVDIRLKNSGTVLSTELKGFAKFRDSYRIASEWRNPETGNRYEFFSKRASFNRLKFVERTIPVIVDPRNLRTYRMDLPPLPKEASGSLAVTESREVADKVREPSSAGEDLRGEIFLSHSEKDGGAVELLLHKLEAAGHSVWCGKPENWKDFSDEEQVLDGIAGARLFLLVLSPDSVESTRVRSELDLAVAKGKQIVTAVLRRTTVPQDVDYALASVHHVDLSEDFETGVSRLLDVITAETVTVTVVPESAAASRAVWLRTKLRAVLQAVGSIFVFMPLIAVLMVIKFVSLALPVRFRPSRLEAMCIGWLGFWDDADMQRSDFRWLGVWEKQSKSRFYECMDRGRLLATEYESFDVKTDDRGRRTAIRILSLWRDPVSHERYRFRSNWLACEQENIKTKIIPVYVDPKNLRRYSVDLSFLPPDQRREIPKRSPLMRRLRRRLFRAGPPTDKEAANAAPLLREQEEGDSNGVFVSYSSEDLDKARWLIEQLEHSGYEAVNRSATEGNPPDRERSQKWISLARTFLIVVPTAAASDLASKILELRHAYTLNKRILPVTFGDHEVPPSMQLSLAGVQRLDLSHDIESGMRVLLNALPSPKSGQAPTPDVPGQVSPSISGGPVQRLVVSAVMGAFSWAVCLTLYLGRVNTI